jgi:Mrp family chromosome partitioning ATPase
MRKIVAIVTGAAIVAVVAVSAPLFAADMTVKGEVVDVACALGKGEEGKGEGHAACAMSCARRGQPVGILTADAVYEITGDYAANRNAKLLDFVAKRVEVTGEVSEKGGKKMMAVKSIKLLQ